MKSLPVSLKWREDKKIIFQLLRYVRSTKGDEQDYMMYIKVRVTMSVFVLYVRESTAS